MTRWLPFALFMTAIAVVAVLVWGEGDPLLGLAAILLTWALVLPVPLIAFGPGDTPPPKRRRQRPPEVIEGLAVTVPAAEAIHEEPPPTSAARHPGRLPAWLWSLLLWTAALVYLVVIVDNARELAIGGRGTIVSGILIVFAPLPVLFLAFRHRPDRRRANSRYARARARLAARNAEQCKRK